MQSRSLFNRTVANGGGTFRTLDQRDVTSGYTVGMVDGTFRTVEKNDVTGFNRAVRSLIRNFPTAYIGTWLNDGSIHVDPVRIFTSFDDALFFAIENKQIAFFHLDTFTEYNTEAERINYIERSASANEMIRS